jgi:hypothetical protein
MEPEVIDDSEWNKDTNDVPLKRKLNKIFGKRSSKMVLDTLNALMSVITTWLYISYTRDRGKYIKYVDGVIQDVTNWYHLYLFIVHVYFFIDFLIRTLAAE